MKQVIDYKILHGFPSIVEAEVKDVLAQDYQPFGKMYPITAPGNKDIDIVVQCMVLYEPPTDRIL